MLDRAIRATATTDTAAPDVLVPEEVDVVARVGALPVDLQATAVIANVWRAAQEARNQLERQGLRPAGLSWGGFSLVFNLWGWGPMETRALAASMGGSRASISRLCATLERCGVGGAGRGASA